MGNKKVLILALLSASIASIIVYRIIKEGSKPKLIELPKTGVVFAKTTIPAWSKITAEQVEIRFIPRDAAQPNLALKMEDVVGVTAKSEILEGEPVNLKRLAHHDDKLGLSFIIPKGKRAITIPVNEVLGVAGFIKPGEKVDLIGTFQPENSKEIVSWTLLQDVEVLAVAQDMGAPGKDSKNPSALSAKVGTSVTLAVTPFQAQKIVLSEEKGTIHLALRPVQNEAELDIPYIRESNLLPGHRKRSTPVKTKSTGRYIEIISGGKSRFVRVY